LKILQISDKSPDGGGVGAYVSGISAELAGRGHEVIGLRLGKEAPGPAGAEAHSHRLPASYGWIPGRMLLRALRELLVEVRPELIHVHECFTTLSPVLLSELRRSAPLVGTLHDVRPFCYVMTRRFSPTGALCRRQCGFGCFTSGCVRPAGISDFARLPRRWMMDRLSLNEWRRLDLVVVPSAYMYELALEHGIAARNLRLVPHGTPVPPELPTRERRSVPALILYLGGLIDYKGPAILLEALASIRERPWNAILAGDGPMRAALERAVERHGLKDRVRLEGHIRDRSRIGELLGRARLLALPSLIPESFALAGIEALAMGTPVVSFGLGGVAQWLRDGENGLIAADGDAADLARQMGRLVDDPALAEDMGKRGRGLVAARFSSGMAADGLLAVYREALQGARA
jgi:glycosyltransferase involved in cell wall biosynthesis